MSEIENKINNQFGEQNLQANLIVDNPNSFNNYNDPNIDPNQYPSINEINDIPPPLSNNQNITVNPNQEGFSKPSYQPQNVGALPVPIINNQYTNAGNNQFMSNIAQPYTNNQINEPMMANNFNSNMNYNQPIMNPVNPNYQPRPPQPQNKSDDCCVKCCICCIISTVACVIVIIILIYWIANNIRNSLWQIFK